MYSTASATGFFASPASARTWARYFAPVDTNVAYTGSALLQAMAENAASWPPSGISNPYIPV
jgi:hypothetical protein